MKILTILKQFLAIGVLLLFVTSCGKKNVELDTAEQSVSEILRDHDEAPIYNSHVVAKIQKDGHEYQFVAIGDEGDLVILEKLYGEAEENFEHSNVADEDTPYDVFLRITDNNVEVPLRIAETVDESEIENSNRQITTSSSRLEILDPEYSDYNTEDRGCYDVGYNGFRNSYCMSGGNRYDRRFCENWLQTWDYQGSAVGNGSNPPRLKKVRTWTNVLCGTTTVKIHKQTGHYTYPLVYQVNFNNGIWYCNYHASSGEYWHVHRITSGGSKFRAFTRFCN